MIDTYLGALPCEDPLYGYLQDHILPQAGVSIPNPAYRVFGFPHSRNVYLYEEKHSGIRLIGKFFKSSDPEHARKSGETEFRNLIWLRSLGFSDFPHCIVRPFGFNPEIGNLLVTEYLNLSSLDSIIFAAIYQGNRDRLFRKLTALAYFLVTLHNRTAGEWTVNFQEACDYADRLVRTLIEKRGLNSNDTDEVYALREAWRNLSCMSEDRRVIVHGDATPSNLLIGRGSDVAAIDVERMKWADRVFDLGRLCGELKHFFFRATGNPFSSEPFIGHFLWEYACHFPDRDRAFRSITRRIPFYMGITLLRIARNSWIDADYRQRLINEAKLTLRNGL